MDADFRKNGNSPYAIINSTVQVGTAYLMRFQKSNFLNSAAEMAMSKQYFLFINTLKVYVAILQGCH